MILDWLLREKRIPGDKVDLVLEKDIDPEYSSVTMSNSNEFDSKASETRCSPSIRKLLLSSLYFFWCSFSKFLTWGLVSEVIILLTKMMLTSFTDAIFGFTDYIPTSFTLFTLSF